MVFMNKRLSNNLNHQCITTVGYIDNYKIDKTK
jgi:hypothetical protein